MYTYYDGMFRGIYISGKYCPLNWTIKENEIVDIEINLTKNTLTFGLREKENSYEVDIRHLKEKAPLYCFVEMYEKNNSLEFIKL